MNCSHQHPVSLDVFWGKWIFGPLQAKDIRLKRLYISFCKFFSLSKVTNCVKKKTFRETPDNLPQNQQNLQPVSDVKVGWPSRQGAAIKKKKNLCFQRSLHFDLCILSQNCLCRRVEFKHTQTHTDTGLKLAPVSTFYCPWGLGRSRALSLVTLPLAWNVD